METSIVSTQTNNELYHNAIIEIKINLFFFNLEFNNTRVYMIPFKMVTISYQIH